MTSWEVLHTLRGHDSAINCKPGRDFVSSISSLELKGPDDDDPHIQLFKFTMVALSLV